MNRIADRTCNVISDLMGGAHMDRHGVAKSLGVTVAAADRYMRSIATVPGVALYKAGRRLLIAFSFSNALKKSRGL
jgi:hypothetical protein